MKIVLYSPAFHPLVGGLSSVAILVAEGLKGLGDEVTVLTTTPSLQPDLFEFRVCRTQSWNESLQVIGETDVVLMFNVSLKALWMPVLRCKPMVLSHHDHYFAPSFSIAPFAKRLAARSWKGVAVSESVNRALGGGCAVVSNPYDESVFRLMPEVLRERDLLFVGRLVSEKGADLLLDALQLLKQQGIAATLSVIGEGPERPLLEQRVRVHRLDSQVQFRGSLQGEALAHEMNRHHVIVMPSRCEESFGLAALEGIACGCVVVGNDGGGLPEAIGPCGLTPRRGDARALADALKQVLGDAGLRAQLLARRGEHLRRHSKMAVAQRYRAALRACVGGL